MTGVQRYLKWTWRSGEEGWDSLNKRVWDGSSARSFSKKYIEVFRRYTWHVSSPKQQGIEEPRILGPKFCYFVATGAGWKVLHPVM